MSPNVRFTPCSDEPVRYQCPYCNHHAIVHPCRSHIGIELPKQPDSHLITTAVTCVNLDCQEVGISAEIKDKLGVRQERWVLRPRSKAKLFPPYIPEAIRKDYEEACTIRDLSPKASATLSRRCLQGMIRDFHGVKKDRLKDEIEAIKDKVDAQTWNAIDSLRKIGNIGAHMERDANLIIDVELDEAQLLIELNEHLFKDWYINRHEREQLLQAVADAARKKDVARRGGLPP
jgi:hypothetical protein